MMKSSEYLTGLNIIFTKNEKQSPRSKDTQNIVIAEQQKLHNSQLHLR